MTEKKMLNILDGEKKTSKAGKTYHIYRDENGQKYMSSDVIDPGQGEYFISSKESEFNGKVSTSWFLSKEEYKPAGKTGAKPFYPKKPDEVAMLKEAMSLTAEYINFKLKAQPKSVEELDKMIMESFIKVKSWVK